MFVRNGHAVGSILHEDEPTAKPTKKSAATKKAAAKKAAPSGEVGSTGDSTDPHLSVKTADEAKESGNGND